MLTLLDNIFCNSGEKLSQYVLQWTNLHKMRLTARERTGITIKRKVRAEHSFRKISQGQKNGERIEVITKKKGEPGSAKLE